MLTLTFLQRLRMAGTRCLTAKFLSQGHTPTNVGYSMLLTQLSAKNETVYQHLDCCDLHLATSTCTIALVTSMVLVTMFVRSGRVSSFLLVRPIGCTSHHQPDPVGVGFARRMPNKMRKIRMRHRRQDRLRGVTPPSHGGNQKADLNHLGIHTTTARGACCREAVIGGVRLVDFQASPKSISHQPKHNSRVYPLLSSASKGRREQRKSMR